MHSIVLSCRATHNNELVQETHGNIVMDCNICTNLLDKLKHVVMPLSRKNPCNYIQDIQTRAEKRSKTSINHLKVASTAYKITVFFVLLLN